MLIYEFFLDKLKIIKLWFLKLYFILLYKYKVWRIHYYNNHQYVRCAHNPNFDSNFHLVKTAYNDAVVKMTNNERITIGTNYKPIDLGNENNIISIPLVFHLLDPILGSHDVTYWKEYINANIIPRLNNDFNRNFDNFSEEYLKNVTSLFANAEQDKKNFYLNVVNTLPQNINLVWEFYLKDVILKPTCDIILRSMNNDNIFRSTTLADPESNLNILIVQGTGILGISVFPFVDRNPYISSQIDPSYKYRNAIIINTNVFQGSLKAYNKFRTFTHEIGHWCGLLHTFDNKTYTSTDIKKFGLNQLIFDLTAFNSINKNTTGDLISDTAIQYEPTYGTVYDTVITVDKKVGNNIEPKKIHVSPYAKIFSEATCTPNFYNFMDYTDDEQMCMFTKIQILHMVYMIARFRPLFIKSS